MNVDELLNREKLFYKEQGKDYVISCLNPEHPDNNPSMRIDKLTGLFNCVSCGFRGNLFTLYDESIDLVGLKALGIKQKISELLDLGFVLPRNREEFRRNYRDISGETFRHFEAFLHNDYEDRIVFPIYDITGKLQGLIGRYAYSDADPKYKIYPSNAKLPIYPADCDIYRDSIIIVEGIFDLLNLWDKGLTNVVCTFGKNLGDAKKKDARARNLNKLLPLKFRGVKKLYILYDTGAESSAKNLATLAEDLFLTEVVVPSFFSNEIDAGNCNQEQVNELKRLIYEKSSNS